MTLSGGVRSDKSQVAAQRRARRGFLKTAFGALAAGFGSVGGASANSLTIMDRFGGESEIGWPGARAGDSGDGPKLARLDPHERIAARPVCNEKRLRLRAPHTGESFDGVFCREETIDGAARLEISRIMRDWHINEVMMVDPSLLRLLADVQQALGSAKTINIMSGYRSRYTNDRMRGKGLETAQNSYHILGMAVDLSIKDVPLEKLRAISRKAKAGGIGIYPQNGFLHLDTGPERSWVG